MDCASNAAELHETRLGKLQNPDGLSGYELRASLHTLQRLPAVADYDEATCDEVLSALTSTLQVPTLRMNSFNLAPPSSRDDWEDALSRIAPNLRDEWRTAVNDLVENPVEEYVEFAVWSEFLTRRAVSGFESQIGCSTRNTSDEPIWSTR